MRVCEEDEGLTYPQKKLQRAWCDTDGETPSQPWKLGLSLCMCSTCGSSAIGSQEAH